MIIQKEFHSVVSYRLLLQLYFSRSFSNWNIIAGLWTIDMTHSTATIPVVIYLNAISYKMRQFDTSFLFKSGNNIFRWHLDFIKSSGSLRRLQFYLNFTVGLFVRGFCATPSSISTSGM